MSAAEFESSTVCPLLMVTHCLRPYDQPIEMFKSISIARKCALNSNSIMAYD